MFNKNIRKVHVKSCYKLCADWYFVCGLNNHDESIIAYSHKPCFFGDVLEYRFSFIYGRYVIKK